MELQIDFRPELVAEDAYLAPYAVILGDVSIGRRASIWFHAVARGDAERIVIGDEVNLQDGVVVHADPGYPCLIGRRVTVGHRAIVHGATIEDDVMIGMGAIVLNGAKIGSESIIGAGSLVGERKEIPPRSLVLGVPGRVVRQLTDDEVGRIRHAAEHYVVAGQTYRAARAATPRV